MNYFNYNPDGMSHLGKVWNLFSSMSPDEINRNSYEYTLEIVESALQGNISLDSSETGEEFSLLGYTYGCRKNEKIARRLKVKKELNIVDSFTEDENEKIGFGDISEKALKSIDTMFDEMLDNECFEQSIEALMGIRNEYLIKEGIDIAELLKSALGKFNSSVKTLSKFARKDDRLRFILEGLLSTGHGDELLDRLVMMGV